MPAGAPVAIQTNVQNLRVNNSGFVTIEDQARSNTWGVWVDGAQIK